MRCLHCNEAKILRARGLCYGCWMQHGRKYPILPNAGKNRTPVLPECMACGTKAPSNFLRKNGWHSRDERLPGGVSLRVVYCPDCFALYGWGDEISRDAPYACPSRETEPVEREPRVFRFLGGKARSRMMGLKL